MASNINSGRLADVSAISVVQNASVARDVLIDYFLNPDDCEVLYERYEEASMKYGWREIYRYSGKEVASLPS